VFEVWTRLMLRPICDEFEIAETEMKLRLNSSYLGVDISR